MSKVIPVEFYTRTDTLNIARTLLGKVLCTNINGRLTSGMITETEAYLGVNDRASHAFGGRHTERTSVMFKEGGVAYIYLCYGINALFNVVTHKEGVPHAVLIRGVVPVDGAALMFKRRGLSKESRAAFSGPGKVSQSLGLTTRHTGTSLCGNKIWIEDRGLMINTEAIAATPRIGVDYAGEDALLPYRFLLEELPC